MTYVFHIYISHINFCYVFNCSIKQQKIMQDAEKQYHISKLCKLYLSNQIMCSS